MAAVGSDARIAIAERGTARLVRRGDDDGSLLEGEALTEAMEL